VLASEGSAPDVGNKFDTKPPPGPAAHYGLNRRAGSGLPEPRTLSQLCFRVLNDWRQKGRGTSISLSIRS
jgi:hypothetical protein